MTIISHNEAKPHRRPTGRPERRIAFRLFGVLALAAVLGTIALSGCGPRKPAGQKSVLNIGMILGSGGLGDKSFNDSAYQGLLEAQKKYNIRFQTVNFGTTESNIEALRLFARNKYDLIIGIAYENTEDIRTVAQEFPSTRFAAVDFDLAGDNIQSVTYREQEGDFLIGVLAAMVTKTKYVGVIGGTDIPAIRHIMSGFTQGVAYQDSSVKVFTDFAGTFSDPQVGLALALKRYGEGADVIHNAASKTGLGIIQAAQQTGMYVTGNSGGLRHPRDVGTGVIVTGIVRLKDGQPYIQFVSIGK